MVENIYQKFFGAEKSILTFWDYFFLNGLERTRFSQVMRC